MSAATTAVPAVDTTAADHLTPERWADATRALVAKALGELSHELLLEPREEAPGAYVVTADAEDVEYRFDARVLALEHWAVDPASVRRLHGGEETELDALRFVLDVRERLGLEGEVLQTYLQEIAATLSAMAFRAAQEPMSAHELAHADFQVVEGRMTEGHPCFIANSGRIGWGAEDLRTYAPEAGRAFSLLWVAARRERTTFALAAGLERDAFLAGQLGDALLAQFATRLEEVGLTLEEVDLIPVHPWQWDHRIAVDFAQDVARRDLVLLGPSDHAYQPQQSIRTFFDRTDPSRHYVKTALSVVNMGFVRGLSAKYMEGTPAINDWITQALAGDAELERSGFELLRERAAVGYVSPPYEVDAPAGSAQMKMLAGLWRESPTDRLADGERAITMTSMLHVDREGRSLAGALIDASGLDAATWVRGYLDAYLRPLLHLFYAYELVFMPHGENLILVLRDDAVVRAFYKDVAEEAVLMDAEVELPAEVERLRADVPQDGRLLAIQTDVIDCVLRFLAAILVQEGRLSEDAFWEQVAACARDHQAAHPELAEAFARHDLWADEFDRSCLNRLQLANSQEMVDLDDPVGSQAIHGTLANPLAGRRAGS